MNTNTFSNRITEGVIWKQLLSFFFPILLGAFFQQMYNTADAIIVGRFVGTQALAAVGSTSAFVNLINGFFIGLSTGATVIASQFFGAKDHSGTEKALHTGITLSVILGALTAILGFSAGPWVLELTQTPANCLEDASLYVRIYFVGAVASMVYNMGAGLLRAMGDSKRPLYFLIGTCILNILLDLLFVAVLKLEVAGAALATILSQFISAAMVIIALCTQRGDIKLSPKKLGLTPVLLRRMLQIGLPAGLQFITFDLANLLVQSSVNTFGDITVAAWTACTKSDSIIWMTSGAFGVAVTTFVGQNFGAQKYRRVRQSVWVTMGMSVVVVGLISTVILLFRRTILGFYTTDEAVITTGSGILMITVPLSFVFMPVEVFAGTMRGTGYSVMPTVITCSCVCVFRVLWVLLVVNRWHEIDVLAAAYPISWILAAVVFYIAYLRGTWLKKRIRQCGMTPET